MTGEMGPQFMRKRCKTICTCPSKPSLKIRTASIIFWIYLCIFRGYSLKNIFFRNKTFLVFQNRKLKHLASVWNDILWNLTTYQLIQHIHTIVIFNFCIGCLIELKFCKVPRNSFSNRCWNFFKSLSISKQNSFVYWPNFQWRFWPK